MQVHYVCIIYLDIFVNHSVFERANLSLLPVPKAEEMNRRLGNLVEEFKQLVYPPDYNPDGKAVKRKQGK